MISTESQAYLKHDTKHNALILLDVRFLQDSSCGQLLYRNTCGPEVIGIGRIQPTVFILLFFESPPVQACMRRHSGVNDFTAAMAIYCYHRASSCQHCCLAFSVKTLLFLDK